MKIGDRIGVEVGTRWAEEHNLGVLVQKDNVKNAIDRLMSEGGGREKEKSEEARKIGQTGDKRRGIFSFEHEIVHSRCFERGDHSQEFNSRTWNAPRPRSPISPNAAFQETSKSSKAAS
ncbi:hypothetical protein CsSME_00016904 [Camellia sinensis var. sinensis]